LEAYISARSVKTAFLHFFLVWSYSVGCSHLEVLCISWCHLVTDDGIECLARRANRLRKFICKGASQVSEIFACLTSLSRVISVQSKCMFLFSLGHGCYMED